MRSILLHVNDDRCFEPRLQVALDLARGSGGHLTCMQVTPYEFMVPGDFYGTLAAQVMPALRKEAEELREALSTRLEHEDVAWDWRQEDGLPIDYLIEASSLSDVVVVGAYDPANDGKGPSLLAGELAIRARTAVLVVPEMVRSFDPAGPALVGWNGSLESAHALKAALPLLRGARSVEVATVIENERRQEGISSTEAAEYLTRHGVECELVDLPIKEGSVAHALAGAAAARDASCLVMGAYGHARFVETVFGGVTRELLAEPPLPILMAH